MQEDDELSRIRARRMAELQQQQHPQKAGMAGTPRFPSEEDAQQQQQREQQQNETRRAMLSSLLDNQARERLNTISIVKPEKSRAVEDMIIRMAQSGRLQKRLSEDDVVQLLSELSTTQPKPSITVQRRRDADWSDDEEYNF